VVEISVPENFPEELRAAVEQHLTEWKGWKLLSTRIFETRPFLDKSRLHVTHKAYVESSNVMAVIAFDDINGLQTNRMSAGDIREFLKYGTWFQ